MAAAAWKLKKVSEFHTSCGTGDVAAVQGYLAGTKSEFISGKKVTLIHLDPTGASGLALAAGGGHLGLVHAFLQKIDELPPHAGVNGPDSSGVTPLMRAAQGGHANVCRELIARSADVKAVSLLKTNALHFAAKCRDVHSRGDVYDVLLQAGADESAKDGDGKTPKELFVEAQTKGIAADDGGDVAAEETNKKKNNEPKLVETVYVDEQGRTMKKVVDVSKATWDAMGKRVVPTLIERDGKEALREKRKEMKKDKKFLEAEALYVSETGDQHGLAGFVKVGQKAVEASSLEAETFLVRELVRMGFDKEAARLAGDATGGKDVDLAVEWLNEYARPHDPESAVGKGVEEGLQKEAVSLAHVDPFTAGDVNLAIGGGSLLARRNSSKAVLAAGVVAPQRGNNNQPAPPPAGVAQPPQHGMSGNNNNNNNNNNQQPMGPPPGGMPMPPNGMPMPPHGMPMPPHGMPMGPNGMPMPPPGMPMPPPPGMQFAPNGMPMPPPGMPMNAWNPYAMPGMPPPPPHYMNHGGPPPPPPPAAHIMAGQQQQQQQQQGGLLAAPTTVVKSGAEAGKALLELAQGKKELTAEEKAQQQGQLDALFGKSKDAEAAPGFQTDTQISGKQYKERQLQKFDFDMGETEGGDDITHFKPQRRAEGADGPLAGEDGLLSGNGEGWDQFAANEKKYNVKSDYREELYTTKLDTKGMSKEQVERAMKLAAEIEKEAKGVGRMGGAKASGANAEGDTWATDVKREGEVTSAEAAREAADA